VLLDKNKNMNQKKAKKLRRALRVAALPESKLMINTTTRVIRRGWGGRAAYQRLKGVSPENRQMLVDALVQPAPKEAA
jgi:hypothetical protein